MELDALEERPKKTVVPAFKPRETIHTVPRIPPHYDPELTNVHLRQREEHARLPWLRWVKRGYWRAQNIRTLLWVGVIGALLVAVLVVMIVLAVNSNPSDVAPNRNDINILPIPNDNDDDNGDNNDNEFTVVLRSTTGAQHLDPATRKLFLAPETRGLFRSTPRFTPSIEPDPDNPMRVLPLLLPIDPQLFSSDFATLQERQLVPTVCPLDNVLNGDSLARYPWSYFRFFEGQRLAFGDGRTEFVAPSSGLFYLVVSGRGIFHASSTGAGTEQPGTWMPQQACLNEHGEEVNQPAPLPCLNEEGNVVETVNPIADTLQPTSSTASLAFDDICVTFALLRNDVEIRGSELLLVPTTVTKESNQDERFVLTALTRLAKDDRVAAQISLCADERVFETGTEAEIDMERQCVVTRSRIADLEFQFEVIPDSGSLFVLGPLFEQIMNPDPSYTSIFLSPLFQGNDMTQVYFPTVPASDPTYPPVVIDIPYSITFLDQTVQTSSTDFRLWNFGVKRFGTYLLEYSFAQSPIEFLTRRWRFELIRNTEPIPGSQFEFSPSSNDAVELSFETEHTVIVPVVTSLVFGDALIARFTIEGAPNDPSLNSFDLLLEEKSRMMLLGPAPTAQRSRTNVDSYQWSPLAVFSGFSQQGTELTIELLPEPIAHDANALDGVAIQPLRLPNQNAVNGGISRWSIPPNPDQIVFSPTITGLYMMVYRVQYQLRFPDTSPVEPEDYNATIVTKLYTRAADDPEAPFVPLALSESHLHRRAIHGLSADESRYGGQSYLYDTVRVPWMAIAGDEIGLGVQVATSSGTEVQASVHLAYLGAIGPFAFDLASWNAEAIDR